VKLLFVGHRGAGKSSEMAYLASLIEDELVSVPVPLYNIFQSPAVSHAEVVLAMNLRLLRVATDDHVVPRGVVNEVWEGYLRDRYLGLKRWLFGETSAADEGTGSVTVKLNAFAVELESRIGTESSTRQQVRERLQDRVSEMIRQIGDLVQQLSTKLGKRLLLVVEDLDKFDRKETRELFLEHSRTLTMPAVNVIYSFPVAMRYTDDFPEIQKGFDGAYFLPNIALKRRDGSADPQGLRKAREILTRRVAVALFEPATLDAIVRLSGGHVKTLIQLAQQAVLNAIVAEREAVDSDHLKAAAARLRDDYVTLLAGEQIALLRAARDDPNKDLADMNEQKQRLLYNGSLLEFGNTRGPWGDINPIVAEILDRDDH